jgi:hypothetical protein
MIKKFIYFWRLGWVAFITLLLCAIGFNVIGRITLLIFNIGQDDSFVSRLLVVTPTFLIVGLPFAGWVFSLAVKKSTVLTKPNE